MTQAKSETKLLREHKNHFSLDATLSVQGCYLKFALVFSFQSLCTHLKLESTFSGDVDVMRRKCFLHFKKVNGNFPLGKYNFCNSVTIGGEI